MRSPRAFSLVELLTVMAIIAVLLSLAVPAVNTMLQANQLTQGTQSVMDSMNQARQLAATRNRPAVLRLYRYALSDAPGETPANPSTGRYRALMIFVDQGGGILQAETPLRKLPQGVVINAGSFSTLLAGTNNEKTPTSSDRALSEVQRNYRFQDIVFEPDGSCLLAPYPTTPWCLTLHSNRQLDNVTSLPRNFTTLVLNPINGTTRIFRP